MATPLWMSHGSVCWRRVLPEGDDKIEEGPSLGMSLDGKHCNYGHFWYLFNPIYLIYLFDSICTSLFIAMVKIPNLATPQMLHVFWGYPKLRQVELRPVDGLLQAGYLPFGSYSDSQSFDEL